MTFDNPDQLLTILVFLMICVVILVGSLLELLLFRDTDLLASHKNKMLKNKTFLAFKFIMLINVKMPTIVGISTFMSMINVVFSC